LVRSSSANGSPPASGQPEGQATDEGSQEENGQAEPERAIHGTKHATARIVGRRKEAGNRM
jgi:hypothetical protein